MFNLKSSHQLTATQTFALPKRPRESSPLLLPLLVRAGMVRKGQSSDGLSLLEALVAIILVTVVVSIITPPIFLAVGTRVNNRRTEQALQLAQGEIERVRLVMLSSQNEAEIAPQLPAVVAAVTDPDDIATVGAPTTVCTTPSPCGATELALAEPQLTADEQRFYIQTFRDAGAVIDQGTLTTDDDVTFAFRMGVRIYSAEAADNLGSLVTDTKTLFTSGTGSRRNAPLAVMYTELNRGSTAGGLVNLKDYVD